jgi:hypothetical protein
MIQDAWQAGQHPPEKLKCASYKGAFQIFAGGYCISSLIKYYVLTLPVRAGGLMTLVKRSIVNSTLLHYVLPAESNKVDMPGMDLLLR